MAVPMSGCPLGLQCLKTKNARGTSIPKKKCAGGNNHFNTQSLFEIFCFVDLNIVHTLKKNVIKLEATGRQKVLDNKSKRVKLNGDKSNGHTYTCLFFFYKNSGIEITLLSPNIDILIHFCI